MREWGNEGKDRRDDMEIGVVRGCVILKKK